MKYDGAKELHQIDEQTLEDDESDSSFSDSAGSSNSFQTSYISSLSSVDDKDQSKIESPVEDKKQ